MNFLRLFPLEQTSLEEEQEKYMLLILLTDTAALQEFNNSKFLFLILDYILPILHINPDFCLVSCFFFDPGLRFLTSCCMCLLFTDLQYRYLTLSKAVVSFSSTTWEADEVLNTQQDFQQYANLGKMNNTTGQEKVSRSGIQFIQMGQYS